MSMEIHRILTADRTSLPILQHGKPALELVLDAFSGLPHSSYRSRLISPQTAASDSISPISMQFLH
jgi:hypothetical protein